MNATGRPTQAASTAGPPAGGDLRPAVWVFGATGYAGIEAVRLLRAHRAFFLDRVFGSPGAPDRDLSEVDPSFPSGLLRSASLTPSLLEAPPDAALLALPDDASARLVPTLLERGVRVVDLSGAFRVRDASHYRLYCDFDHPRPGLLEEAVYGLCEWNGGRMEAARLVANPGCYPTAALLGLLPLERAGLLDPAEPVIVDGKSGATGAGRRLEASYLFAEVNESCRPYAVLRHRHVPEMLQALGFGTDRRLLFAPHLLPVSRGLMTTLYLRLRHGTCVSEVAAAFGKAYERSPFVRLLGEGRWPELRAVARTNRCDIGWTMDVASGAAVVVTAIDNLLKGAAGQAVQNLNRMFGQPESEGLPAGEARA